MNDKAIKNLLKALKGKSKPQGYDTTATVTRVEGSTCWVHIPGGVAETPCKLSIDAKEGDTVQVRVAGGKAHLTGNVTAPPTDDSTAKKAVESSLYAQSMASAAQTAVSSVKATAEEAAETAETALTSADGKNTVYYATSLPSGGDYADGDLCFLQNSSGICTGLYVYNGSSWVLKALDADALSVGSLSAISANLGTVTAGTLNAVTINAATINSARIEGTLTSTNGLSVTGGATFYNRFTVNGESYFIGDCSFDGDIVVDVPGKITAPNIAGGYTEVLTVHPGIYEDYDISFNEVDKDFQDVPMVVANFMSTSTAGDFGLCSCAVVTGSVSVDGFTVRIFNGDTVTRQPRITWLAISV